MPFKYITFDFRIIPTRKIKMESHHLTSIFICLTLLFSNSNQSCENSKTLSCQRGLMLQELRAEIRKYKNQAEQELKEFREKLNNYIISGMHCILCYPLSDDFNRMNNITPIYLIIYFYLIINIYVHYHVIIKFKQSILDVSDD